MADDKFIGGFIEDVTKLELLSNNVFYIRGNKNNSSPSGNAHVKWLNSEKETERLLSELSEKDKLFVHWYDIEIGKLCLALDKRIPVYAIFWGGEFYEEPEGYFKSFLFDKYTLRVYNNIKFPYYRFPIPYFITDFLNKTYHKKRLEREFNFKSKTLQRINYLAFPPNSYYEIELIKKMFNAGNIKYIEGFYDQNFDLSVSITGSEKRKNHKKSILIGNSATVSNNHIDCFLWLKELALTNIEIVCPLSYGEDNYKEEVILAGENNFSTSFKPIIHFMKRNEYVKLLSTIDVAIFFNNRSQAFGNIISLIALGKKVFLKPGNPFYINLSRLGIKVFPISENISEIKDDILIPLEKEQIEQNIKLLKENFSDEKRLKCIEMLLSN